VQMWLAIFPWVVTKSHITYLLGETELYN
jgi:hypothetical protein